MLGWFKKKFHTEEQEICLPETKASDHGEEMVPMEAFPDDQVLLGQKDASATTPAEGESLESRLTTEGASTPLGGEAAQHKSESEEACRPEKRRETAEKAQPFLKRLQERLGKTRDTLVYRLDALALGRKEIDQELFDELEEILITADLGVETSMDLLEHARKTISRGNLNDPGVVKGIIQERIQTYITDSDQPAELVMPEQGPFVIMVVGVNGVGKTTTIGKMAAKFARSGQSVLLVAGDTFRAAAIDQLNIWSARAGVDVVSQKPGADPSSVVFDGMEYGMARNFDVIIIDTAGRLHTSVNLMEELKKIKRVIGKKLPEAPHEVMLVLDATTGQNGIAQARLFYEAVGVTGLTMTKLDGTAKGGIVPAICREMQLPVRFIGIGEQMDDLRDFDSRQFVAALFSG